MVEESKQLLIGCGHASKCNCIHPREGFITLDIRDNIEADIVCDINHNIKLRELLGSKQFPAIIFEYFPEDELLRPLPSLKLSLKSDGYIVFVGSGANTLNWLEDGQYVGWAHNKKSLAQAIIIPKLNPERASAPELKLNSTLNHYLAHFLECKNPEEEFKLSIITPEFKLFAEELSLRKRVGFAM